MAAKFILCFFISVIVGRVHPQQVGGPNHGKVVVCYVATWAVYRPEGGKFPLDSLDPALCTHLVYSFAGLNETSSSIRSLDPWQDLEDNYGKGGYKKIVGFKSRYPHLKVTIAIGGWNEGSLKYSLMAEDPEKRTKFIKSVLHFLNNFKFDGLDLDWEYPARRDGRPQDKENFVTLVKELKEAFEPRGYILTAALGAGKDTMDNAYDLPKLSKYLDFIHMMCYDYHGTWDGVVGANAPLKGLAGDDFLSVKYTINYMISHGVSPYKLVLGLPMYGRNFVLRNPDVKQIDFGLTSAKETGFQGPFTKENGFMGYNEICMELNKASSTWTTHWHEETSTPYLRDNDRVISYDNARSIAIKVRTAIKNGLGGLMVWSIDTDDFNGNCQVKEDPWIDFTIRYEKMKNEPIMNLVLERLHLSDGMRSESLNRRSAYIIDGSHLGLRLPQTKHNNYNLMRTINEAVTLSMEEKKIEDEVERVIKENEVNVDDKKNAGSSINRFSLFLVVILGLFKLF